MVGIILASHDEFAEGILQSGAMIPGEQGNVKAVTLVSNEGPDDVKAKMQEAITSFDSQDEILLLVGLQGGTSFDQANSLLEDRKDKRTIVVGMSLPIVIEACASRPSMESAQEIATHILEAAKDGAKIRPEKLQPAGVPKAAAIEDAQPEGSLPPGTVIGDSKTKFVLARIDSRLLHGQVATARTKATQPDRTTVVSDAIAKGDLRKKLTEQATPPGVRTNVIPISKIIEITKDPRFGNIKVSLSFENPKDVLKVVEGGVEIPEINVGSMAHSVRKVVVSKVPPMDQEDVDTFGGLKAKGVKFDVHKAPDNSKTSVNEALKKTKDELANA